MMRRHPFDALSFVFGTLFAAVAAALASDRFRVLDLGDTDFGPMVVIAVGAALVVVAIANARTDRDTVATTEPSDDVEDEVAAGDVARNTPEEPFGPPARATDAPEPPPGR